MLCVSTGDLGITVGMPQKVEDAALQVANLLDSVHGVSALPVYKGS